MAAEAPAAPPAVSVEDMPKLTLNVLEMVKTAQQQNGLRHGDYQRYSQYCARRLRRIRQSIGVMYGRGKKYANVKIVAETAADARHLMVPLFNAERAWAVAMALKQDMESSENSRLKFHMVRKLVKAAQWGAEVKEICAARCDGRSALEAEAYGATMCGHLALEKERWAEALQFFGASSRIFGELGTVGTVEQQDLFSQAVEESKPRLRYCRYQLGEAGGDDASALVSDASGDKLLQGKLKAVLSESLQKAAEKMDTVPWHGHMVPVRSEALRMLMLQIADKAAEADQAAAEIGLLGLYDDAAKLAAKELKAMEGMKSGAKVDEQRRELVELGHYLAHQKISKVMRRNSALLEATEAKLAEQDSSSSAGRAAAGGVGERRPVRPDDLIHLYDQQVDYVAELRAQPGAADDEAQAAAWEAQTASSKAHRTYYVAAAYALSGKWREAALLHDRASELAAEAAALGADAGALLLKIGAGRCKAKAQAALAKAKAAAGADEDESKEDGGVASSPRKKDKKDKKEDVSAPRVLLERLECYDAGDKQSLYSLQHVPPALTPIACKPMLFDIAFNAIAMPSNLAELAGDAKKKKKKKKTDQAAAEGGGLLKSVAGWLGGGGGGGS